jgi:hypothetical protein
MIEFFESWDETATRLSKPPGCAARRSGKFPSTSRQEERVDAEEKAEKISALLHEAAETHHTVYRISDGDDPDWASWYADWLTKLSELPDLLNGKVVRSELVYMLVRLDKEYAAASPDEKWEDYYARSLVEHFRTGL